MITETKRNEISAARQVLRPLDLPGKIVLADALHTHVETAQQIHYERGADYLLTVKGNQPTRQETLHSLFEKHAFSPSAHAAHADIDARAQSGTIGNPFPGAAGSDAQPSGLSRGPTGGAVGDPGQARGKWARGVVYLLSRLTLEQLHAQGMLRLKRKYWVIESRLHHCLDITLQEDLSRVRTPHPARVLGMIRRVALSWANAAVDRARRTHPKTKCNSKSFPQHFLSARGGRERLHARIHSKHPAVLALEK